MSLSASVKHFYLPNTVEASLLARNADPNTNTVMNRFHEESYRSLSAAGNSCIELGMWLMCLPPALALVWVIAGPIEYHDPKQVGRRV